MDEYTTRTLTRKQAIGVIAGKIFTATDKQLEDMLKAIDDDYNDYVIVDGILDGKITSDSIYPVRKDIYG